MIRHVWVESFFGEANTWHDLRRFRLRGLTGVNIEDLVVAAGQNVKRPPRMVRSALP